ncbi:MAG: hypothetical protein ICV73_28175, partial [Acetobacteraceae bacterium]|nr:hypothetical protein [Acetobacteraceae bacterium]
MAGIARAMVFDWGMGAHARTLALKATDATLSEETKRLRDEEQRALADGAYADALALLADHRAALDRLAGALLDRETLDRAEIAAVLEGVAPRLWPLWIAPRLEATLAERAPDLPASAFGVTGYAEPSVVFAVGTGTRLLRTGGDAARFLAEAPGRVAAVGHRAEADFQREAASLGLTPMEIGTVTGLNYTRGRWITLILYRTAS